MTGVKPTDIVIPVAVYNDMQKKIEHLNADTRRKQQSLAKALKYIDKLTAELNKVAETHHYIVCEGCSVLVPDDESVSIHDGSTDWMPRVCGSCAGGE